MHINLFLQLTIDLKIGHEPIFLFKIPLKEAHYLKPMRNHDIYLLSPTLIINNPFLRKYMTSLGFHL